MDFHSSLRKSFKSHGSYNKHSRRISAGSVDDIHLEHQPILSHPYRSDGDHGMRSSVDLGENREVIVKIDSGDNNRDASQRGNGRNSGIWRGSSYEFWTEDHRGGGGGGGNGDEFDFHRKEVEVEVEVAVEDPPSQLIRHFLNRQRDAGGDMPLDMDMEMEELRNIPPRGNAQSPRDRTPRGNAQSPRNITPQSSVRSPQSSVHSPRNIPAIAESPVYNNRNRTNNDVDNRGSNSREVKVSFKDHIEPEQTGNDDDVDGSTKQYQSRRRSSHMSPTVDNTGACEVLRCTSFQRRASTLKIKKTQSRLMDSSLYPERISSKVGKSGPEKSGILGRASGFLGRVSGMLSKPGDDDEDDSLVEEDIPYEFKKNKLDALTLLQWISLIIITTALISTLAIPKLKRRTIYGLGVWEWEVLVLALICGRLLSGWMIRIVVFFIERNFLLRKRVLYFVYGLRKAVQNCIWLGLVLLAWQCLFDKKVDGHNVVLTFVNRLMFCMLVASLLWLVKTLMVKVLASSFHVSTFFDRIQDSLFNQYVIETLSGPPLIEIQNIQEEDEKTKAEISELEKAGAVLPADLRTSALEPTTVSGQSGKLIGSGVLKKPASLSGKHSDESSKKQDEGISIDHLHKLNPKNVSAWNMKRLMKIVRHGFMSTIDEQILNTTQEDESSTEIRSEFEAKVAARKIFRNVAKPQSKFIDMEDLMRFLRQEEAIKTMALLEGSPDGERISKAALKNWVVNAFRERRALALTLNDTKTAVKKLHQMVNVLVSILILIICLVILGIATSKFVLFLGSQIVVVAFVFGNTCKQIFEAVIFLFAMHPFDVGDRCEIDGVQLIVEEMNILTTVFLRFDNLKIVYPNSTLATKPISNYYRSPDMGDAVDFVIHIATPKEKIDIMKQRITSYIEETTDHWYSAPSVVLMNLEDLNKMKMSVWLRHKMNHQDMGERWTRRALVIDEMVKIFKDLGIEYRLYPLDINVCSMPAVSSTRLPPMWTSSSQHVRKSESISSLDVLKTL